MAPDQPDYAEILKQPYPPFLRLLDSDNERALAEFGNHARRWLISYPSPCLRSLSTEEREEVVSDVILHLIKDDARRLRSYEDRGRPFHAFLRTVAERMCLGVIRKRRLETSYDEPGGGGPAGSELPPSPPHGLETVLSRIVWEFVGELDVECQLLLIGHFRDGLKPRQMVPLLGFIGRENPNKKVSDRLTYCKTMLATLIRKAGYKRDDFID